ncbi:MAG TPA: UDP-N-acetylmuramoyl-tripeptide--D-alanyl-D-alanine ligase [Candidatus Krumholzibacteria bacterium]|nr:UDP-N-acetylmuramoyl-tripeptide--D-alanyl-D-alanine ligase [Candidatus Krumholzibacteria bacterium]
MTIRTLEWVCDALDSAGQLLRAELGRDGAGRAWSGAAIDSRAECSGRLFFAIQGERTDGHRFAAAASRAGSPLAIISDQSVCDELRSAGAPFIVVRDTRIALQDLARAYRRHLGARVVAITGSSGKTTTKEYVRAVLKTRFRTHANAGNFNSSIGVPVTILEADELCEYLVCEVGANHAGEIDFLGDMLRPDLAVITNIGDAHVGYFGSRDAIATEKGALLAHLGPGAHAVLPRDDEYFDKLSAIVQGKVFSFGRSPAADFRLANVEFAVGQLSFTVNGEPLSLSAVGDYNAMNACAAFAVGDICGVDAARQRQAFESVRPTPGRGRIHFVAGVTVIDESYNASPASMHKSLAMLAALPASRRIAVLGDMKELGDSTGPAHRGVGEHIAEPGVDHVYWLGGEGDAVRAGAAARDTAADVRTFAAIDPLVAAVAADARDGDVVLVKGSHSCRLEDFVAGLVAALTARN